MAAPIPPTRLAPWRDVLAGRARWSLTLGDCLAGLEGRYLPAVPGPLELDHVHRHQTVRIETLLIST